MINPMDLTGKHIAVAGASSGIGAETARHITRLGGKVSLIARREEELKKVVESLEDKRGKYYLYDFSDPGRIESLVKQIYEEQGAFDGAVYSAGYSYDSTLKMAKYDKLKKMAEVNYISFVEFVRCVTLKKYRSENMSVIGISSVASRFGDKGKVMYSSTKAAMDGAMRSMAHELAPEVRINNILPGFVKTEMLDQCTTLIGHDKINKFLETNQYMGELLDPIDIANAAAFLLSDASRFITGIEMVVAGGYLS